MKNAPIAASPPRPKRASTRDSAEHLFAAFPVLALITKYTGKIGLVYIKQEILSGKIKNAKRNATIIIAIGMIAVMFLLVMGVLIWLALL
jgi:uncharacterized membrane protein (DUF485 family)